MDKEDLINIIALIILSIIGFTIYVAVIASIFLIPAYAIIQIIEAIKK